MHVVVIFGALSPYHLARIAAAHRKATFPWRITTIERVGYQSEYPLFGGVSRADVVIKQAYNKDQPYLTNKDSKLKLRELLTGLCPDCVVFGLSSPVYYSVLHWCITQKVPAVLFSDSTASDFKRSGWKERVKARLLRLFSAGFVAGTLHADYLQSLGMAKNKIFLGYDVVDNSFFRQGALKARENEGNWREKFNLPKQYFLTSARFIQSDSGIARVKNLHGLIEAYSLYLQKSSETCWSLVILGDGELRPELEKQIKDLGLVGKVLLPGFKQYEELPVYYGLSNVFILASIKDTWGLVVNEAMACGLPVLVSTRCGCAPDLVDEGRNGFTFNPYNVEELAEQMLKISSNSYDLPKMGDESREIVSRWSTETFAEGLFQAVCEATASTAPKHGIFDKLLLQVLSCR